MFYYIVRRLLLLPLTLFCIVIVNFLIINLAPGDPVTITEMSQEGAAVRNVNKSSTFDSNDKYLQFREKYGLTLPILFNLAPWISDRSIKITLEALILKKFKTPDQEEIPIREYENLKVSFGDQSKYIMNNLLSIINNTKEPLDIRIMASHFFIRGGTFQALTGFNLTEKETANNKKIAKENNLLKKAMLSSSLSEKEINFRIKELNLWFNENRDFYHFTPSLSQKISIFLFETRFFKYISKVFTLNFGSLRNDADKTVISEVTKRFKYSLTLALIPMLFTFFLCQVLGFIMAYNQNHWPDYTLNFMSLILYAIPVFVVAPFLIEEIAMNLHFPFTQTPIPISGFTSPDTIYNNLNSYERLIDILKHLILPFIAVMYSSLASQARLSRTAVLEVLKQDFVRTAKAKGVSTRDILLKHVARNASVTIVTSIASSLGIVLGGSLIVETLFEIDGFGRFFYEAVVNRDYNVIMFSSLAGSLLSLMGFLVADIAYTVLDPRLTLE